MQYKQITAIDLATELNELAKTNTVKLVFASVNQHGIVTAVVELTPKAS